jgi:hypothetical protein
MPKPGPPCFPGETYLISILIMFFHGDGTFTKGIGAAATAHPRTRDLIDQGLN